MRARRMRRALAGVLGLSLFVGVGLAPSMQTTDAAWTDTESMAPATFAAATLAPPQITSVVNCTGLLGLGLANGVTMRWTFPTGGAYTGFTPEQNAQWAFNGAGDNWTHVATSVVSPGVYQTTFNTGVISDLLALLLGGSMTFQIRTKAGTHWYSEGVSKVTFKNLGGGPLGLSPVCSAPSNGI